MKRTGANEREQFNEAILKVGQNIAREMGLDSLPMLDPSFDFFGWGVKHVAYKYGKRGLDAFEIAGEAIQEMLFNPRSEDHLGSIYSYSQFAGERPDARFDLFFKRKFEQHVNNEIRKRNKYGKSRTKKHLPIMPGRSDELVGPGVAEESLKSGFPAPSARMEETEHRQMLDEDIPAQLARHRNGRALLEYYRLYREGAKAWDILDHLNKLSAESSEYWPENNGFERAGSLVWNKSMVGKLKDTLIEIMRNYFQRKELTRKDVISASQERAIFQRRGL